MKNIDGKHDEIQQEHHKHYLVPWPRYQITLTYMLIFILQRNMKSLCECGKEESEVEMFSRLTDN